jgi:hypothetical protein
VKLSATVKKAVADAKSKSRKKRRPELAAGMRRIKGLKQ